MRLNTTIPSYLLTYINTYRKTKCIAWYVIQCIKYCNDNKINLHEYYEGINNERLEKLNKEGKS